MSDNLGSITPPKEVLHILKKGSVDNVELSSAREEFQRFLGKIDQIIIEKEKLGSKVETLKEELGEIKTEKKNVEQKLEAANAKLDTRPFLELTENEVVPTYFRNAKYLDPVERWYISIRYEVTIAAKLLAIRHNRDYDEIWKVSQLLVRMFRGLSNSISHSDNSNRVQFSDREWQEVFQHTSINVEADQKRVKDALKPLTDDQLDQITLNTHFVILASGIGLDLENRTEFDEIEKIKEKCKTYANSMSNFYFPVSQGKYKKEVFFQVDETDDKIIEALEKELKENVEDDFKTTMKIRKIKVFSRQSHRKSSSSGRDRGTKRTNSPTLSDNYKRQRTNSPRKHYYSQSHSSSYYSDDSRYSPYSHRSSNSSYNNRSYNRNRYAYRNRNPRHSGFYSNPYYDDNY